MLQPLPLGRSTFSTLRARNEIYVDKTALIHRLAQFDSKIFLARPRRFGKSLLVSTFESLFKNGLRDFEGLAIEKLWKDKTYPVVRLDFSGLKAYKDLGQFQIAFQSLLSSVFAPLGFHYDSENQTILFIDQFKMWLSAQPPSSFVLLIDEYDAPLTNHLDSATVFDNIRDYLGEFYAAIKQYEGCLRFVFMTGITKFSNTSIFSAFNNIEDISLDEKFGELLGYTEEEIAKYFEAYLQKAQSALQLSKSELLVKLREQYDGFSFDRKAATHVYCPWSVLNFLKRPEEGFRNYWYTSGGQPTVLMKYLADHALQSPTVYNESVLFSISDLGASRQCDEISVEALLTQAGYLTIKEGVGGDFVRLGYPNEEVARSMARLYAAELLKGQDVANSGVPSLFKVMAEQSPETVVSYFNRALGSIDYVRYPIENEAACRAYLQVLLIGAALLPKVEVHNALGRSDMEVEVGNRHWVFEFKFAKTPAEVQKLLNQAVSQMQSVHYGENAANKHLIRVAMVFSAKDRRFSAWKVV